jgi:DNA-directed RNA polymerase specialized sigma24 family protein
MKDPIKMYRRLFSLAFKRYDCDRDMAHDLAADAICSMLKVGTEDISYGWQAVKNAVRTDFRNKKRRQTYQFPVDEEGEPMELKIAAQIADADLALIASECLTAIDNLAERTRDVMRLVALDYTSDEIVSELNIPKSEVYWRTQLGRKLLRQRDGYELERKRGHHKYIGIRKDCRKWTAAIRKGEEYFHLGYFQTASDAAKAYDAKAQEIFGADAKLNFPNSPAHIHDVLRSDENAAQKP